MRNGDRSPTLRSLVKGSLHDFLGVGIQSGSSLKLNGGLVLPFTREMGDYVPHPVEGPWGSSAGHERWQYVLEETAQLVGDRHAMLP